MVSECLYLYACFYLKVPVFGAILDRLRQPPPAARELARGSEDSETSLRQLADTWSCIIVVGEFFSVRWRVFLVWRLMWRGGCWGDDKGTWLRQRAETWACIILSAFIMAVLNMVVCVGGCLLIMWGRVWRGGCAHDCGWRGEASEMLESEAV